MGATGNRAGFSKDVTMRDRFRGIWILVMTVVLVATTTASAQEQPNPEQLKKAYDDALAQLKAAQERKNQLAAENEKLGNQILELQKQVEQSKAENEQLKRIEADHAKNTYFLRSHYAAWQQFVRSQPDLLWRWKIFFEDGVLSAPREALESLKVGLLGDEP
jgi:septal ring factor EnvC (AmiA/AmiB activator)